MSRVDSSRIAAWKAEDAGRAAGAAESWAKGSVVASDAYFPFADGLLVAADAGATAIIQPGGSIRDNEVIAAADERGLAMVFQPASGISGIEFLRTMIDIKARSAASWTPNPRRSPPSASPMLMSERSRRCSNAPAR